ncbi:MAG: thioesterase superfamily protein [Actinomycetia bacterium]|nr:thioesterase superfamily protein [Actinomycetes bacterium]
MTISEQRPPAADSHRHRHILNELHFLVSRETARTGTLTGEAQLTPFMHAPGTPHLRTSILVIWADMLSGLLSLAAMRPRVPVTLELDINLYRPAPGAGPLRAVGNAVKTGRSVHVMESTFLDADGTPFAFSTGLFMASPDVTLSAPPERDAMPAIISAPMLSVPLAERAGLLRVAPGSTELPLSADGLNASNTMNGGLIGMAAEEAVLSLAPAGSTVSSLALRYLSPVRTGPAVATASGGNGLYRVELRDAGNNDRLAVLATARTF